MRLANGDFLRQQLDALRAVVHGTCWASRTVALELGSRANEDRGLTIGAIRAHAKVRGKQYQNGHIAGMLLREQLTASRSKLRFVAVRLVRCAPKALDDDNLASAFKSVRDGVADALGVDDREPFIRYVVDQEFCPHALVRIELWVSAESVFFPTRVASEPLFLDAAGRRLDALPAPKIREKRLRSKKKPSTPAADSPWWRAKPAVVKPKRR